MRRRYRASNDLRGEPIRRVIFSEPVPLVTIDQRLVENLENIRFDIAQLEAPHMRDYAAYQVGALGVRDDPIEKIALNSSENARRLKPSSGKYARRIVLVHIQDGKCDRFGDDDQKRMLEKKLVAFHLAAVNELE